MSKYNFKLGKTQVTLPPTKLKMLCDACLFLLAEQALNKRDLFTRLVSRSNLGWDVTQLVGERAITALEKQNLITLGFRNKYELTPKGQRLAKKVKV